jgi:hypothetical protein
MIGRKLLKLIGDYIAKKTTSIRHLNRLSSLTIRTPYKDSQRFAIWDKPLNAILYSNSYLKIAVRSIWIQFDMLSNVFPVSAIQFTNHKLLCEGFSANFYVLTLIKVVDNDLK